MEIDFVVRVFANATDHKTAALLLTATTAATKYGITITAAVAQTRPNQIKKMHLT